MQVSLETQDHKLTVPHVYSPNSIILESECFTFYSCPYIYEQDSIKLKGVITQLCLIENQKIMRGKKSASKDLSNETN